MEQRRPLNHKQEPHLLLSVQLPQQADESFGLCPLGSG